jgi:hypothetical protein
MRDLSPLAVHPSNVLALTLWGEAEGEPDEGKQAVAWVIRNRAEHRRRSIADVCFARRQFSCFDRGSARRVLVEAAADTLANVPRGTMPTTLPRCLAIARDVLDGSLPDNTGGADHYVTRGLWLDKATLSRVAPHLIGRAPCAEVGHHVLFDLEGRPARRAPERTVSMDPLTPEPLAMAAPPPAVHAVIVHDPGPPKPPRVDLGDYVAHFVGFLLEKVTSQKTWVGIGSGGFVDQLPIPVDLKAKIIGAIAVVTIVSHAATDVAAVWKGVKTKPTPK